MAAPTIPRSGRGLSTVFRGIDNGYRAELIDFAAAVRFGVVQRALDSAVRAAVLALDPVPGAGPVPLWRPRGSTGLFGGQPGQRISSSASFAA